MISKQWGKDGFLHKIMLEELNNSTENAKIESIITWATMKISNSLES